jgi:hypothetical protein
MSVSDKRIFEIILFGKENDGFRSVKSFSSEKKMSVSGKRIFEIILFGKENDWHVS